MKVKSKCFTCGQPSPLSHAFCHFCCINKTALVKEMTKADSVFGF